MIVLELKLQTKMNKTKTKYPTALELIKKSFVEVLKFNKIFEELSAMMRQTCRSWQQRI